MLLKQGYLISKSFTIIIHLKIESYNVQLKIQNVSMPVVHLIHVTTEMTILSFLLSHE